MKSVKISRKAVPRIAEFFSLGQIRSITSAGGEANANFFVETLKGSFFIKIVIEPHSISNKLFEIDYVEHMSRSGVPCAPYLRSRSGLFIYNDDDGIMATTQTKVAGINPPISKESVAVIAKQLANIHLLPSSLPYRSGWFSPGYIGRSIDRMNTEFRNNSDARKIVTEYNAYEGFRSQVLSKLPVSVIHGDAHSENVLFSDGKLVAFVDWEDTTIAPSLLDFAISVADICFSDEGEFDPELYGAFYRSYNQERPLTPMEIDNIETCMGYVGTVQTIWKFLRYGPAEYSPRGLELKHWKAPTI